MINQTASSPKIQKLRDFIAADFQSRLQNQPDFSLRRYATSLGINDSTLSQILRGKRTVAGRLVQNLGRKLGLAREQIAHFVAQETTSGEIPLTLAESEQFRSIRDWRYDAVLELVDGLAVSHENIGAVAVRLGVAVEKVASLISILKSNGFLSEIDGHWRDNYQHVTRIVSPMESDENARAYQKSLLETSLACLQDVPARDRNHTSVILKINKEDLPAILGVLKESRRKIALDYQNPEQADRDLYALQISLFPLAGQSGIQNA